MAYPTGPITEGYKDKTSGYNASGADKKLVSYVMEQHDLAEHAKSQVIEDTWLGMAFLTGHQWTRFNRIQNVLTTDNPPAWRVRMVLNYILPTVETFVGKLTENRPGFICLPATNDDDDIEAARQCDKMLEYEWERAGTSQVLHELAKWVAVAPIGFLKMWWDPTLGEDISVDTTPSDVEPDADGVYPRTFETRKSGEVVISAVNPLEVAWDPGAKDKSTCQWMYHANFMHIDRIRERWPAKGKYVHPTSASDSDSFSQQLVRHFRGTTGDDDATVDRALVVEYFEKASPRHPRGLYAVVSGGVLLEKGDLPFNKLPFFAVRHNTVPGRWPGEGMVKSLIPAQKELNKSASQRIENKNLHAQPKWVAEKGSVEKGAISDEPGEIIFYNRTASRPPMPMPPPGLSPEHERIQNEQIKHIENISGISDVTRGQAPASFSGRAIRHSAALDHTKLGPTVREFERAVADACSYWLLLLREYMPKERMLRVSGRNNELEVFAFYRSKIKNTEVRIQPFSMLSRNIAVRQELVLQMYQLGLYGDQQDPRVKMQARKDMEFGNDEITHGDRSRDRNYAREENYVLSQGQWTDAQPWEDHITHIDELLSYMKGVDYRLLDDETKLMFQKHLAWHYHLEAQQRSGVPWWAPYADSGDQGWPPVPAPEQQGQPQQEPPATPPAPPVDAFNPTPEEIQFQGLQQQQAGAGAVPLAAGMGGMPELNQAVGPMGPGVGPGLNQ